MLGMDIDSQTAPTLVKDEFKEYEDGVVTGCQDPGEPAPSLLSFSVQSCWKLRLGLQFVRRHMTLSETLSYDNLYVITSYLHPTYTMSKAMINRALLPLCSHP